MVVSMLTVKAQDHPIDSVAIFTSSKAEIVRTFTFNLKAGLNKIEIEGLPSTIDTHSIRVSGFGEARLCDVVCTIGTAASNPADNSSELVHKLKLQKQAIENEKQIRETEAELLLKYAQTLTGENVTPTDMSAFLGGYVEKSITNFKAISALSETIRAVERQIDKETEKTAAKVGDTRGKVSIVLGTDEATPVDLKLTYIVNDVNWSPVYELHASTESGKPPSSVTLHYRARVRQSTGEDWCNSAITLSTASSDLFSKKIPELQPVKLCPQRGSLFGPPPSDGGGFNKTGLYFQTQQKPAFQSFPLQQAQKQPQAGLFGSTPFTTAAPPSHGFGSGTSQSIFGNNSYGFGCASSTVTAEDEKFEEVASPAIITESAAFVAETPVAISYYIKGNSTIPSDGIEHQVSVSVLPFDAQVSYVAIPRADPRVYLQCQVKNTSDYRLLAGPVSVILDDSYVSRTIISDVNVGDHFNCTLGDDPATKVSYTRNSCAQKKEDGGVFSEAVYITKYTTKITIHNMHPFAIPALVVRDVIPTCDDKRTKVVLRKPEELANAKAGHEVTLDHEKKGLKVMWEKLVDGKEEGKFQWKGNVREKDKLVLEAEWEVKAPFDTTWTERVPLKAFGHK